MSEEIPRSRLLQFYVLTPTDELLLLIEKRYPAPAVDAADPEIQPKDL